MLTVFTNYGFEYLMKHRCFQNQLPANAKDRAAVRSNAEKYNANKKRFDKIIHDSNQKSALAFKQLTQSKNKNCPTFKFDYNKEEEAEGAESSSAVAASAASAASAATLFSFGSAFCSEAASFAKASTKPPRQQSTCCFFCC